ncbi:hypothetical protein C2S53_000203 [Perilla frutescens var. hirtella]|uniref:Uncharacterized protein n=1 Tax=Perilla frutescens var. hirtella TaxID=608512 RepID=A0AAD4JAK3_PERFH|nr:hypothetical protein C2S53_000203 [Perilla frutescens var. hirtella]
MASVSAFSLSKPSSPFSLSTYPSSALSPLHSPFPCVKFQTQFKNSAISCISSPLKFSKQRNSRRTIVRAVAEEEETLVTEEETSAPAADAASDQTVSVAVSPSDVLTMFFQAEGTMADLAAPAVTKALEEVEGIADLKVQVLEGIASVELRKQTTVQATGVASGLVEIIQGSGFKLQTLNLSFQDEEDLS